MYKIQVFSSVRWYFWVFGAFGGIVQVFSSVSDKKVGLLFLCIMFL